eukprot:TRINITY_DN1247_c1_g1_i3.p1 TRINITY_DN1247_c1_g1~~TRINITY_DN1247_c1_g1_i3.p1  ORF type:complete len:173 (+),score=36.42 TRINITY_DN1247_c1_g1_i3:337-855(+)
MIELPPSVTERNRDQDVVGDHPLEDGDHTIRLYPHKDLSSITLLYQTRSESDILQVFDVQNESWVNVEINNENGSDDVDGDDDTLLVNTGDLMHKWTSGYYPSTLHRVVSIKKNDHHHHRYDDNMNTKNRFSIVYFAVPNWESKIYPLTDSSGKLIVKDDTNHIMFGDMVPW